MKIILYSLLIFASITFLHFQSFAQDAAESPAKTTTSTPSGDSITEERSRQFHIGYLNSSNVLKHMAINAKIKTTYVKENDNFSNVQYLVTINTKEILLSAPARFSYFNSELIKVLKNSDTDLITTVYADAIGMFSEIVLTGQNTSPTAGTLILNDYVRLYEGIGSYSEITNAERVIIGKMASYQTKIKENDCDAIKKEISELKDGDKTLRLSDNIKRAIETPSKEDIGKIIDKLDMAIVELEKKTKPEKTKLNKSKKYLSTLTELKDSIESKNYEEDDINKEDEALKSAITKWLEESKKNNKTNKVKIDSNEKKLLQNKFDHLHLLQAKRELIKKGVEKEFAIEFAKLKKAMLLKVEHVQLHFESGYLEKIQVETKDADGATLLFENLYPMGFSSRKNFADLYDIALHERKTKSRRYIYVGDIIQKYRNKFDNFTRDYSPADTAIDFKAGDDPNISLKRTKTIDILDIRVYTDIMGFNSGNPNGLIQTELKKKFNLYTSRMVFSASGINHCVFSYINVFSAITKFEQKSRYLTLQNQNEMINGKLISPYYATTLDFMRYSSFNIGTELNIYKLDFPDAKFTLDVDLGMSYMQTPVSIDSSVLINSGNGINNKLPSAGLYSIYPRIKAEVFAEKRFGVSLAYQMNNSRLLSNNRYKQVMSYEKDDLTTSFTNPKSRWNNMFEIYGRYAPGKDPNGKIFVRARVFTQTNDYNTHFAQFQVGYAFHLNYTKK